MFESAKSILIDEFKEFFEKNPEFTAIKWNQYTPYFNDGEPCEFSVGSIFVTTLADSSEMDYYGEYEGEFEYGTPEYKENSNRIFHIGEVEQLASISEFVRSDIGESVFRKCFGEHSIVVVTKDGVEIEEYDHD